VRGDHFFLFVYMADEGWQTITSRRARPQRTGLKSYEAERLELETHVQGLARALLSQDARNLYEQGYVYHHVSREAAPESEVALPIGNKWDDWVVFRRQ
jgi:hypothetical protein